MEVLFMNNQKNLNRREKPTKCSTVAHMLQKNTNTYQDSKDTEPLCGTLSQKSENFTYKTKYLIIIHRKYFDIHRLI